jgi:hypothetical protein
MRRAVVLLPFVLICAAISGPSERARAQVCSDDYVTVETVAGTILSIDPAPDPFKSADIFIAGPGTCKRLWMQVLKTDARQCRIGDRIQAKGVITSDPENLAWQINPELNPYMLLGTDFTCTR